MMMPRIAAVPLLCLGVACHIPDADGFTSWQPEDESTSTTAALTTDHSPTTTVGGASSTTGDLETTSTSAADTSTGDASTGDGTVGELLQPKILAVDFPDTVQVAGPAGVVVSTEHTITVRARLDGVELDLLADQGAGDFAGVVPVFGSVDNGAHVLEVIAENGDLSDARTIPFEVAAPAPGKVWWMMQGPQGSRTEKLVLTPEYDVIEVGTAEVAGVARPAMRKRSGLTGLELWPEGTLVLDDRQGSAVDVAVAPDGRLWVAMNVREANNQWRARIALFDANGHAEDVELPTYNGPAVTAIKSDGLGGCVAVGYASTGEGDTDVAIWRMTADHLPLFSAQLWDYWPNDQFPHSFTDLAFDVLVTEDIGWIIGASQGKHNQINETHFRGMIVRMDIDTLDVLGPVIVAPPSGAWTQSTFYGAALAGGDEILVTGNGCNDTCASQRVEIARYDASGARTWHHVESPQPIAFGTALALNAHGVAVVAVTQRDGAALRGYLFGRTLGTGTSTFVLPFPASNETSAADAVALDFFDRAWGGGYTTTGGATRAYLVHPHQ